MLTFEQIQNIIAGLEALNRTREVELPSALGYVLQEDIRADIPMPPFDKAAVDGYACRKEDLGDELEVLESIPAGAVASRKIGPKQCSRIMTGASVPEGADLVFMSEDSELSSTGRVRCTNAKSKKNICYLGEDYMPGALLLKKGEILRAEHLAVIAGAGVKKIKVAEKPRVGLIVTGSELVNYHEKPGEGKIRNTNTLQMSALLEALGIKVNNYGMIRDEYALVEDAFRQAVSENDIVLFTGGAADGDFDLVPRIIAGLDYQVLWARTGLKPGNPMSCARKNDKYILGLSGNPVSSLVQFEFLVKPVLYRLCGSSYRPFRVKAAIASAWSRKNASRYGVFPIRINDQGEIEELPFNGSAHISAFAEANALMEVPVGQYEIKKGEGVYVRPL